MVLPEEELEALEGLALSPVNYFALDVDCPKEGSKLPSTEELTDEEIFADLSIAWSDEKIIVTVQAKADLEHEGNSVELFFDTRDLKTAGFNHRFCHHFLFDADHEEAQEITRFRTEDRHELADPGSLHLSIEKKKKSYMLTAEIPAESLHGYAPDQFNRLGFTYRINRAGDSSQHFTLLSREYPLDQSPSLWATLRLVK